MFEDMPQVIPQGFCLSCDGCCRFKDSMSPWRPRVVQEEKETLSACASLQPEENLVPGGTGEFFYIKTAACQGQSLCAFLHQPDNTCRIYTRRPLECRLYPFLLTKKNDVLILAVHLSCPFVQDQMATPDFEKVVEGLKRYFQQKDILDFLRKNPVLAWDYSTCAVEIKDLFGILPPRDL